MTAMMQAYNLALDAAPVDRKVSKIRQKLLRSVLALNEFEEVWRIVDELNSYFISK